MYFSTHCDMSWYCILLCIAWLCIHIAFCIASCILHYLLIFNLTFLSQLDGTACLKKLQTIHFVLFYWSECLNTLIMFQTIGWKSIYSPQISNCMLLWYFSSYVSPETSDKFWFSLRTLGKCFCFPGGYYISMTS